MKRIIFFIIKWAPGILFFSSCSGQNSTVILDSAYCFKSDLPPGNIKIDLQNAAFSKAAHGRFNFGFTSNEYCYIVLKASTGNISESYVLSIDNTSLDTVEAFSLQPDGSRNLLYSGGNLMKYKTGRDYAWHTFPLNAGGYPHYYLIAVKAVSKNVNLQYQIIKQSDLQKLYRNFDRVISFYAGTILFVIFISILAFLLLRNFGLLLYAGYILSVTIWLLSHYGYFFPLFHPSFSRFNDMTKMIASLWAIIFFLCLILYLFKNDIRSGTMKKIIRAFIGINLIFIGLALARLVFIFPPSAITGLNIAWHVLLILSACMAIPLLLSLFHTSRSAQIFFFAATCPFIMLFIQILSNTGYVTNRFLNNHGVLLANLVEIFILLSGIIYHIWEKERAKDTQLLLMEEDRRETLKKLIMVQDNERKRIAEELHDSIGPLLAAIRINFLRSIKAEREHRQADALIARTENIIDDSISEIRNIAHRLMPKGLSSKGLVTLLTEYFDDLGNIYPVKIEFRPDITTVLNGDFQLNLYRIISELVLNAAKHSKAKAIHISMETQDHKICIIIRDDGIGFSPAQKASGIGLKNIESRVSYLKGVMNIQSSPGNGSCLIIDIPCEEG
ncbi:MAG: hypothetical protein EPN39_01495 [Chitinophagaceae bacterium]|nr:MAG: hypothetical protein EPN39_01495 [Chitinophagaceae bacterium]